jgi:hypothetical protein
MTVEPKRILVDVVRVEEPWAIAHLADGTQVKVKIVFDQIMRTLDPNGKPAFGADGNPDYYASFKWAITVNAPASAKAKVKP